MMNYLCLVGRLVSNPTLKETETGQKYSKITLAVPRSYKNMEGIYETDFIDIALYNNTAERTVEYCQKGDVIGIKGRLETNYYENENGEKKKSMIVIAEKVSFLSAAHRNEEDEEDVI